MTARILALSDVFDYDDETDATDAPPAGDGEPRA